MQEWQRPEKALEYLSRLDRIPHRTEGEAVLLDFIPPNAKCVLDLGTGDGRLLALVKAARPEINGIAMDFSPAMLENVRKRFAADSTVTITEHDMTQLLPALGPIDVVVSSFAIHHLEHPRKRSLYGEIYELLSPGGVFYNLEHVSVPSERLHDRFLQHMGRTRAEEDTSNRLLDVETQVGWLREIGFQDVDCHWKWLEFAVFGGVK